MNTRKRILSAVLVVSMLSGLMASATGCTSSDTSPVGKPMVLQAHAADGDLTLGSGGSFAAAQGGSKIGAATAYPGKKEPELEEIRKASQEILKKISEGGFDESLKQVKEFFASAETRAVLAKYKEYLGESLQALANVAGDLTAEQIQEIDVNKCVAEAYDAITKMKASVDKVDWTELEGLLDTGIDLVTAGIKGLNDIDIKKWAGEISSLSPEFQKILDDAKNNIAGNQGNGLGSVGKATKDSFKNTDPSDDGKDFDQSEIYQAEEARVGNDIATWGLDLIKKIMVVGIDTTVLPALQFSQNNVQENAAGYNEALEGKRDRSGLVSDDELVIKDNKAPKSVVSNTDPFVLECRLHDIMNRNLNAKDLHPSAGASEPDGVWPREPSAADKDGSWVYRYYNTYYSKSPLDTRTYGRIYSDTPTTGIPPLFRDIKESYRNARKLDLKVFEDGRIPTTAGRLGVVDEVVLGKARADMQYVFSTIAGGEVVARVKEMISQAQPLDALVGFKQLEDVTGFRYNDILSAEVFKCIYDLELSQIKESDIEQCIEQKNAACRQAIEGAVAQSDLSSVDIGKERLFYDWFLTYFYLKNYSIL